MKSHSYYNTQHASTRFNIHNAKHKHHTHDDNHETRTLHRVSCFSFVSNAPLKNHKSDFWTLDVDGSFERT